MFLREKVLAPFFQIYVKKKMFTSFLKTKRVRHVTLLLKNIPYASFICFGPQYKSGLFEEIFQEMDEIILSHSGAIFRAN